MLTSERRFYVSYSYIYGLTVYDRTAQAPAFEYGASPRMDSVAATMLSARLNARCRRGQIA